jgi:hypothetical protein
LCDPSHQGRFALVPHWQIHFLAGSVISQTYGVQPVFMRLCDPSQYGSVSDQPHWQYAFLPGVSSTMIGRVPRFGSAMCTLLVRISPAPGTRGDYSRAGATVR